MGPITLNPSDPATFLILVVLGGIVVFGIIATLRETIASAILLAESRKQRQKLERELKDLQQRGKPK